MGNLDEFVMKGGFDFDWVGTSLWTAWYLPAFVVGFVQQLIFHPLLNNLDQQYCANKKAALRHMGSCLSRITFLCFFSPVRGAFYKLNCFALNLLFADLRLLLLYLQPEKLSVLHWPFGGSQRHPKWSYGLSGRWDSDLKKEILMCCSETAWENMLSVEQSESDLSVTRWLMSNNSTDELLCFYL